MSDEPSKIFLICKNLQSSNSSLTSQANGVELNIDLPLPAALKHWGIMVHFMHGGEVDKKVIYDAGQDPRSGRLVAKATYVGRREAEYDEWREDPGFEDRMVSHICGVDDEKAQEFIKGFNELKMSYSALMENCQKFVKDFIAFFQLESSLPPTIWERTRDCLLASSTALSGSVRGCSNIGLAVATKELVLKSLKNSGELAIAAVEQISIQSAGAVSLLEQSPIKEFLVKEGKRAALTAFGEMTENLLNASKGAFSPWNLLQIPVELITKPLLKWFGASDVQASVLKLRWIFVLRPEPDLRPQQNAGPLVSPYQRPNIR